MSMYSEAFCKVYNEFGWNYYPEAFGEELMEWIRRNSVEVKKHLDLGCGTGVLCESLTRQGIASRGMDFSQEMIDLARIRAKEQNLDIPYEQGDMILYCPEERYDLVTCTGDALNHITEMHNVERIFENIHTYLKPGGYFIFDLLNISEVDLDDPIEMDWDDKTRSVFMTTQDPEGRIHLHVTVYEEGKNAVDEDIVEIIHDEYAVMQLLKKTGFEVLRCDHTLLDDQPGKGLTWFIIAKNKEKIR